MEKSKKLLLYAFGVILSLWVLKQAIDVVLLAFAALLLAILLHTLGYWTRRLTRLPYPLALLTSLLVILGAITGVFWLYAPLIGAQFEALVSKLPSAAETVRSTLLPVLDSPIFAKTETQLTSQKILSQVVTVFSMTIGSLVSFVVFLILGLYLAMAPETYHILFLESFAAKNRNRVQGIIAPMIQALQWWLVGKMAAMVFVGLLSFLGLWILDVQLAFILGLLAALLTFIPYLGPILASVPAILIAFTQEPVKALYVIILYLAIHGIEGYLFTPMVEQKTVSLPPALTILAQILFAVLFGALGVVLATPLAVVAMALLKVKNRAVAN